ncbi:MAG: GGDEF domain-containing protein [Sulfuricurvum sp.]|nr:GGDEF domain-containing protein [Sulfuricurvum sp.]
MYTNPIKALVENFLFSGHTFTHRENDKKFKFVFLNHVIGFAAFVAFIMGFVRIHQHFTVMGYLDFLFSFIFIFFLIRLRASKEQINFISTALIVSAYLLFTAIYVLATNQANRLSLFFLLLASAYFLKGRRIGFYWLLIIVVTIISIQFSDFVDTHHSSLDIFSITLYLIALYFILDLYEEIKNGQTAEVQYINDHLETLIRQRTNELEIANRELETEKYLLEKVSSTDPLTGLHNRYQIKEIFDFEVTQSKRYNTDLSIIMMDLDYFKLINDTYGHVVGDQFLKEIAAILKNTLREAEVIVRWGGEEFLIIVPKADLGKVHEIAERLRTTIEQHEFHNIGKRTASFGVTSYIENDTFDSMILKADNALYTAKAKGRNQVESV